MKGSFFEFLSDVSPPLAGLLAEATPSFSLSDPDVAYFTERQQDLDAEQRELDEAASLSHARQTASLRQREDALFQAYEKYDPHHEDTFFHLLNQHAQLAYLQKRNGTDSSLPVMFFRRFPKGNMNRMKVGVVTGEYDTEYTPENILERMMPYSSKLAYKYDNYNQFAVKWGRELNVVRSPFMLLPQDVAHQFLTGEGDAAMAKRMQRDKDSAHRERMKKLVSKQDWYRHQVEQVLEHPERVSPASQWFGRLEEARDAKVLMNSADAWERDWKQEQDEARMRKQRREDERAEVLQDRADVDAMLAEKYRQNAYAHRNDPVSFPLNNARLFLDQLAQAGVDAKSKSLTEAASYFPDDDDEMVMIPGLVAANWRSLDPYGPHSELWLEGATAAAKETPRVSGHIQFEDAIKWIHREGMKSDLRRSALTMFEVHASKSLLSDLATTTTTELGTAADFSRPDNDLNSYVLRNFYEEGISMAASRERYPLFKSNQSLQKYQVNEAFETKTVYTKPLAIGKERPNPDWNAEEKLVRINVPSEMGTDPSQYEKADRCEACEIGITFDSKYGQIKTNTQNRAEQLDYRGIQGYIVCKDVAICGVRAMLHAKRGVDQARALAFLETQPGHSLEDMREALNQPVVTRQRVQDVRSKSYRRYMVEGKLIGGMGIDLDADTYRLSQQGVKLDKLDEYEKLFFGHYNNEFDLDRIRDLHMRRMADQFRSFEGGQDFFYQAENQLLPTKLDTAAQQKKARLAEIWETNKQHVYDERVTGLRSAADLQFFQYRNGDYYMNPHPDRYESVLRPRLKAFLCPYFMGIPSYPVVVQYPLYTEPKPGKSKTTNRDLGYKNDEIGSLELKLDNELREARRAKGLDPDWIETQQYGRVEPDPNKHWENYGTSSAYSYIVTKCANCGWDIMLLDFYFFLHRRKFFHSNEHSNSELRIFDLTQRYVVCYDYQNCNRRRQDYFGCPHTLSPRDIDNGILGEQPPPGWDLVEQGITMFPPDVWEEIDSRQAKLERMCSVSSRKSFSAAVDTALYDQHEDDYSNIYFDKAADAVAVQTISVAETAYKLYARFFG